MDPALGSSVRRMASFGSPCCESEYRQVARCDDIELEAWIEEGQNCAWGTSHDDGLSTLIFAGVKTDHGI